MSKNAAIYRMVTPGHLCRRGVKARDLLNRNGYEIEGPHLESLEGKSYQPLVAIFAVTLAMAL